MKFNDSKTNRYIDETAQICGEVAVGCSQTAGTLQKSCDLALELSTENERLETIAEQLSTEIEAVAQATIAAQALSDKARAKLQSGNATIASSMSSSVELIQLVDQLGTHIVGFASAMDQVKRVSYVINSIAKTTNMLALNASIEAEHAGEAGRTFAIVAAEVKKLSLDTKIAAEEITNTVNSLSSKAEKLTGNIARGIERSDDAQARFSEMEQLFEQLQSIVSEVDARTSDIAANTEIINHGLFESRQARTSVKSANARMQNQLNLSHREITNLEIRASTMFDKLVHSGMSFDDSAIVEIARHEAIFLTRLTEDALACGSLTVDALFDKNLVEIAKSNPSRFRNGLTDWADQYWRPELDRIQGLRPEIKSVVCSAKSGFLPTHMTISSGVPIGDPAFDNRNCQNGRIYDSTIDQIAKASEQDYMMAVYRLDTSDENDNKDGNFAVRNVYIPLYFMGQRWGDFEIAYVFSDIRRTSAHLR